MPRVFSTEEFDKIERELSNFYQQRIESFISQLKVSYNVGNPLGYSYFREKKMDHLRVYFLVYEDLDAVLLVAISNKKTQEQTIVFIKEHLKDYLDIIRKKLSAL